jgi:hypothetical protein
VLEYTVTVPQRAATVITPSPSIQVTVSRSGAQGPPGPPGVSGGGMVQLVTSTALSGHRLVVPRDDGKAEYADCATAAHISRPVWLTTGAWDSGVTATLVAQGIVTEPTWSWTPGQPIWLGLNGVLTQTIPGGALFIRRVAEVIDATTIEFSVGDSIAVI